MPVRRTLLLSWLAAAIAWLPSTVVAAPIVVELFTSNSCSSCPPAYALLDRVVAERARTATPVIRLDEHVDYWNQLNWVDRYSDAQYTQRQREYAARVFHHDQVYTPQLIVNGRHAVIGNQAKAVRAALDDDAGQTTTLHIAVASMSSAGVTVRLRDAEARPAGQLWFALTQDHVVAHVGAGENAGRTLHENGVVRWLAPAGQADTEQRLPLPRAVDARDLHVVAFIENASHRIVAAGQAPLGAE